MSGVSSELIDYLEGRISFEQFEIRREERKAKLKVSGTSSLHAVITLKRSNLCTSFGARNDIIYATGTPFTNACVESISSRISSLRYRTKGVQRKMKRLDQMTLSPALSTAAARENVPKNGPQVWVSTCSVMCDCLVSEHGSSASHNLVLARWAKA